MVRVPSAYGVGYEEARRVDPETADNYIQHAFIGEPVMDVVVDDLAGVPRADASRFVRAGMEQEAALLRNAPKSLRDFFVDSPPPEPPWLNHDAFTPGIRAFHANISSIFAAFVTGTLIDGVSTLIAKSFVHPGRVFDSDVRRLRQNNRHQVEIFFPGGLRREGEGWKLSVRIRLVHAKVRHLLRESGEWDEDELGTPLSAAPLGFAIACFSARTADHALPLGATFTPEEQESFCAVWRYAGHLMGIPDTIFFPTGTKLCTCTRSGPSANRLRRKTRSSWRTRSSIPIRRSRESPTRTNARPWCTTVSIQSRERSSEKSEPTR